MSLQKSIKIIGVSHWLIYLLHIIVICCFIYVLTNTINTYVKYISLPSSGIISSVADDEFYVLQVAKNFVLTNRISFDGEALTTGFHPLYFLLLSFIYLLTNPDVTSFLMMSILLKTIFAFLSSILIFTIIKKLSNSKLIAQTIGIIISLIFLAHPYTLFLIFSGIEQLISIFFFLCFLLFYTNSITNQKQKKNRNLMLSSILFGLAYLSRTDNLILLPIILAFILLSQREKILMGLINIVMFSAGYLLTIIPWYIFIYIQTGTLSQGSGNVKMFLSGNENQPFYNKILSSWQFIKKFWWPFLNHELIPLYKLFWGFLIIVGIYLLLYNLPSSNLRKWIDNKSLKNSGISLLQKKNLQVAGICIFYIIVIAFTYGYIFYNAREWYYGISLVAALLLFVATFNLFFLSLKNHLLKILSVLIIVLSSIITFSNILTDQEFHLGKFTNQKEMLMVSEWMKLHLPPNAIVGSWNSGIFGFFSERQVVNLDGLINNDILPYLKSKKLFDYIKERRINYIIDYSVMPYWQEKYLGKSLSEIPIVKDTAFPGTWQLSDIYIWKLNY